ncbi:MAG: bacillithiol biosynthesis deacetylase BshB1, partial [Candidatus Zixiibacteriota bacterium]
GRSLMRALVICAHPDDVELTCAGTLIKLVAMGYSAGVIALTSGEKGTRGSAEDRRAEFEAASRIMKLTVHKILSLPDGNIEVTWENKIKVIQEIRSLKPKIVFLPYWEDRHPDHVHTGNLVGEACFLSGLKKVETGQEVYRPRKLIYYMCHYEFEPSFVVDVSAHFEKKLQAIRAYKSQFYFAETDNAATEKIFISTQQFLEGIITRAKYYGSRIGVEYGEPFLIRETMEIADPVSFFEKSYF